MAKETDAYGRPLAGAAPTTWIWDPTHQLYFSPQSGTYAYTNSETGQWVYLPASAITGEGPSSSSSAARSGPIAPAIGRPGSGNGGPAATQGASTSTSGGQGMEDGEIEDDVGWGGLMEPEELQRVMASGPSSNSANGVAKLDEWSSRHTNSHSQGNEPGLSHLSQVQKNAVYGLKSYSDSVEDALSNSSPAAAAAIPTHLLRLVVTSSESLTPGHVAIIDAREGGVQLGRDRCEKGGGARLRVKEMEVSKTHGVIYWGQGADEDGQGEDGWFIVDLGSTHGIYITPPTAQTALQTSLSTGQTKDGFPETIITTTTTADSAGPQPGDDLPSHRLSPPKASSLPYRLEHLSHIRLGMTVLEAHIHLAPAWPCQSCQLSKGNEIPLDTGDESSKAAGSGLTRPAEGGAPASAKWGIAMDSKEKKEVREINRKREMAALRESLLNKPTRDSGSDSSTGNSKEKRYIDRSALRRQLHPPSAPANPPTDSAYGTITQTRTQTQTPPSGPDGISSFAQGLLSSQGWQPGQGLGKTGDGRSTPVEVIMRTEKRGLGASGSEAIRDDASAGEGDWRRRGKMRRYDEIKGRF